MSRAAPATRPIPAAKAGCPVTGVDIATNLAGASEESGRRSSNLDIRFEEGDAEDLPFPDRILRRGVKHVRRDVRPASGEVAAELLRVCKPGGVIAMANWTPQGFVGKTFQVTAKMVPPPPEFRRRCFGETKRVGAAALWARRKTANLHPTETYNLRIRFRRKRRSISSAATSVRRKWHFRGWMQSGQAALAAQLESLWAEHNTAKDGTTAVKANIWKCARFAPDAGS